MEFWVEIKQGWKTLRFKVIRLDINERTERYAVIGRNKTIELMSDRPFWRNRGLKKRRPKWRVVAGEVLYGNKLEELIDAIMEQIEPEKKP